MGTPMRPALPRCSASACRHIAIRPVMTSRVTASAQREQTMTLGSIPLRAGDW